jgi:hypothetical protein
MKRLNILLVSIFLVLFLGLGVSDGRSCEDAANGKQSVKVQDCYGACGRSCGANADCVTECQANCRTQSQGGAKAAPSPTPKPEM